LQVVEGEGSRQPSEPRPPSSTTPPSHEEQVGDEAVYTGEDDRVVRDATTATSLEAEQENGNIHKTLSTTTLNEPSPHGTSSGSRPRCQDTTLGDADAQTRVLALEQSKTDQDLVIKKLQKKVIDDMVDKAIENAKGDTFNAATGVSATSASVTTAGVSISTAELRTPPTTTTKEFEDEDLTIS
nr:hypothetical protein [Tanacetum cinerariifolium]